MSDPVLSGPGSGEGPATLTVANRLSGYIRGGGVLIPIVTALIAFFIGGIVIALAGANPIDTYRAIFEGSGLNWLLPWVTGDERTLAALNLQQTLILTAPLILTGLAVAFAFRAGLFNIGGNGQYLIGSYGAVYAASSFEGMPGWLHIIVAMVAGAVVGALWGGIAGFLKAATGANEVISTIMLNYTALYIGLYFFGTKGPLHSSDPANASIPVSNDVLADTRLPVFWGDPELQGLHTGIFIAVGVTALFWVLLNRSTTGYEVRAVGFNPDAAEYGGISAGRNYVKVMLICGAFAGLAGAIDVLGWQYRIATIDVQVSRSASRHRCRAARPQHGGRHGDRGAALCGAAQRHLSQPRPERLAPELAATSHRHPGLIVLFVSARVLLTMFSPARLRRRGARRTRRRRGGPVVTTATERAGGGREPPATTGAGRSSRRASRASRGPPGSAGAASSSGLLGVLCRPAADHAADAPPCRCSSRPRASRSGRSRSAAARSGSAGARSSPALLGLARRLPRGDVRRAAT